MWYESLTLLMKLKIITAKLCKEELTMTKQSIISNLKNISDSYRVDTTNTVTMFHINDTGKCFLIRVTVGTIYCGTIYCDCIKICGNDLIQFINDGKIIAIFDCSAIDEIDLLYI